MYHHSFPLALLIVYQLIINYPIEIYTNQEVFCTDSQPVIINDQLLCISSKPVKFKDAPRFCTEVNISGRSLTISTFRTLHDYNKLIGSKLVTNMSKNSQPHSK